MIWSIERKLAGAFGLMLIVMVTIGIVSYHNTLELIENDRRVAT